MKFFLGNVNLQIEVNAYTFLVPYKSLLVHLKQPDHVHERPKKIQSITKRADAAPKLAKQTHGF